MRPSEHVKQEKPEGRTDRPSDKVKPPPPPPPPPAFERPKPTLLP